MGKELVTTCSFENYEIQQNQSEPFQRKNFSYEELFTIMIN